MRWKGALEGASWIVVVPAVLFAVTRTDVVELAMGAFGPPAAATLGRWLLVRAKAARPRNA